VAQRCDFYKEAKKKNTRSVFLRGEDVIVIKAKNFLAIFHTAKVTKLRWFEFLETF